MNIDLPIKPAISCQHYFLSDIHKLVERLDKCLNEYEEIMWSHRYVNTVEILDYLEMFMLLLFAVCCLSH